MTFFAHRPISLCHNCVTLSLRLASCYLLLYVVYMCQKSFKFINPFACYKQKCKLPPLNFTHPVLIRDMTTGWTSDG